jgi:16S rRNA (cytosine967-C5)-methyltransferase
LRPWPTRATDLRVNVLKAARESVRKNFPDIMLRGGDTPLPEGIRLGSKPALTQWPAYREGRIEVQDEGSQLIARLGTAARRNGGRLLR